MNISTDDDTCTAENKRITDRNYLNHFIAGEIAGMCGAFVSYPMDTVKTRIQIEMIQHNTVHRASTLSILRQITIKDGIRSIYKGVLFPFLGYGIASSFVFGVNNIAKTTTLRMKANRRNSDPRRLSLAELSLCGGFTGFTNTFVVTPIERIKVWSQSHQTKSLQSFKSLYKELGIRKGLFSGVREACCFQLVSFCAYFPIYELSLKMLTMKRDRFTNEWRSGYTIGDISKSNKENISSLQILISGGLAGVFSWIIGFPIDNIKTRVQSGLYTRSTTMELVRKQKMSSLKGLYRGIMPTVYRAAILHSTIFLVYERALLAANTYNPSTIASLYSTKV